MVIRAYANDAMMIPFGVHPNGLVEIPWSLYGRKAQFREFAEMLAAALPDAEAVETPKTWQVKQVGKWVDARDLLAIPEAVRVAIERLNATLREST